jgi:hypothetical protein
LIFDVLDVNTSIKCELSYGSSFASGCWGICLVVIAVMMVMVRLGPVAAPAGVAVLKTVEGNEHIGIFEWHSILPWFSVTWSNENVFLCP